jgi:NAD(P)-dependent dehydrogenase (short-subunit alcohol dehydrogenase family)/2-polyprenyl-3-methyl-5-hydroxy-6-metoxy-1,4-benzoquinol methylase
MKLEAKVVLVTGAGRGIGRSIALAFANEGASVALMARTATEIEETARLVTEAGGKALPLTGDVCIPDEVDSVVTEVERCWGLVEVLVNNAGMQGPIGPAVDAEPTAWLQTLQVNLCGPFLMCRRVLPSMMAQRRGKIINISGGGASSPRPFFSAYASSKAGLVRLTETLADELKEYNIQVNAIAPGAVATRMTHEVLVADIAAGEAELIKARELVYKGSSSLERATALAVFLASEESDGITGRLISAVWDKWEHLQDNHLPDDAGTLRRIPLEIPQEEAGSQQTYAQTHKGFIGQTEPGTSDRVNLVVKILRGKRANRLLDIGCGDGRITSCIAETVNVAEVHGVDVAPEAIQLAQSKGIRTAQVNLDQEGLPYPADFFDLVLAMEVLEHVFDPGSLLDEAYRVLVPGGHLILTTPNLGSWYNRLALLLGFQPWLTSATLCSPNVGKLNVSKFLKKIGMVGGDHLRVITLKALKDAARGHGFVPVKIYGVSPTRLFDARPPVFLKALIYLFQKTIGNVPSLSSTIVADLVAKKESPYLAGEQ